MGRPEVTMIQITKTVPEYMQSDGEILRNKLLDWWLNKLDEAVKAERERVVEMIEKYEQIESDLHEECPRMCSINTNLPTRTNATAVSNCP